jgi:hypothetical protein
MNGEKPVTPAQAAHETEMRRHQNGALNLAKWIPEFIGKVLGPWLVPAPQDGPGMYRYAQTPGVTREEREAMEPPRREDAPLPAPPPRAVGAERERDHERERR